MKKVILYGIRGSGRKEIEFFLDNSYEIIAYSDSDIQYDRYRYINYKRFFEPARLVNLEFDYVIITPKNLTISNEIKEKLLGGG